MLTYSNFYLRSRVYKSRSKKKNVITASWRSSRLHDEKAILLFFVKYMIIFSILLNLGGTHIEVNVYKHYLVSRMP